VRRQNVLISSSILPKHIPELDGIRGFAIILVVIYHYLAVPVPPDAGAGFVFLRQIASNGWSGVDLFFVLSG
jgi:peptidoglycan/LPS O-acetylase OafA/YrhL